MYPFLLKKAALPRPTNKHGNILDKANPIHVQRLAEQLAFEDLSDHGRTDHIAIIAKYVAAARLRAADKELCDTLPRQKILNSLFNLACLTGVPAKEAGLAASNAHRELLIYDRKLQENPPQAS
jgi:hypothetical protein